MVTAIICAAGRGERAGFSQNKILKELNGLPVLCYSLTAFSGEADEILVACREEDEAQILPLLSPFPAARTVRGGRERCESVYNALKQAKGEIVLVHDGARPFVSAKTVRDCIASVKQYGSGVCALPATDTTVTVQNGQIVSVPPRAEIYTVQTPQGFYRDKLLLAYGRAFAEKRESEFTDESGVYARYVCPPRIFSGERNNKKLTFPEDFMPAERVGFGVDTHPFYTDEDGTPLVNFITLCGVRVPSDRILKAHSDGDVAVHALMDALLSAAGLFDIGHYFPDTDERFRGANSMELLAEVLRLVKEAGFAPKNVSVAIVAETPRLSPYIEEMKQTLANALSLPLSAVGIAAGTNEKLGYVGEKKGITVYSTAMLCENILK